MINFFACFRRQNESCSLLTNVYESFMTKELSHDHLQDERNFRIFYVYHEITFCVIITGKQHQLNRAKLSRRKWLGGKIIMKR